MIALGTMSFSVFLTMLQDVMMRSSEDVRTRISCNVVWGLLMTSTSIDSRSDSVPEALRTDGGASMAAIFFLFLAEKKLPKKLLLSAFTSLGGVAAGWFGIGLPVLGSTWTGLLAPCRSLTI